MGFFIDITFLFLHFALEFARCPYRILQINYVDVDDDSLEFSFIKMISGERSSNMGKN